MGDVREPTTCPCCFGVLESAWLVCEAHGSGKLLGLIPEAGEHQH